MISDIRGKKEPIYAVVGSYSFAFGSNCVTFSTFHPRITIKRVNQLENETPESKKC